jgi:hypothetical protein
MGDRAYVRITCRREDAARFEQLGFVDEETAKNGCAVAMVEEAANYAHYSALTNRGCKGPHRFLRLARSGLRIRWLDVRIRWRGRILRNAFHAARIVGACAHPA